MESLQAYRKKRNFRKTEEPLPGGGKGGTEPLFVIQKHAATRLHYDFRLAMGGVLVSWAVPKGIPYHKGEKRLAVHVEDHPIEYATFEGTIPEGEYGAGTVMVWDYGRYELQGGNAAQALQEGKLHLRLHGKKLNGEWTLVRTQPATDAEKELWLLMKTGASVRPVGRDRDNRSALSGRTMAEIAAHPGQVWHSNREKPHFVAPMKATLLKTLPEGSGWTYEVKWDGYRAVAVKQGRQVRLYSRNERLLDFPGIAEAVLRLRCESVVLDGELVALDSQGRPRFDLLKRGGPAQYYLFDLLFLNGEWLLDRPLKERRERLAALLKKGEPPLRLSAPLSGTPQAILEQVRRFGLEGVMAKREESVYRPGIRSREWAKVKVLQEQEFVIGGYTHGKRSGFGALLLGYYRKGVLQYAGRVGTGFGEAAIRELKALLEPLEQPKPPFAQEALSRAERKGCVWVKPCLVCQVAFSEWTPDGRLRHPVYLGLRDDKRPREVVREEARSFS